MATYYPEVYQYHFDWGAGVGTESGYTLGTIDTDGTVNVSSGDVNKYLRFVLNQRNTKTLTNPTRTYKLICRRNSSDWGTAFDVTASSSYVRMYNHASLTHGDDCTDRLGVPSDSYWFSNNNGVCDTSGTMGASLTWPDSSRYRSEHLWSLEFIKDDLANNDVLDFRVVESDGTVLYSYTIADATITVTKVTAETGDCTDGIKWGDDPSALKVISVDGTDGIKWGDDLSPVLIASSLTDGIKIGENIDTVTYESFGGDGIKWGDLSEGGIAAVDSATDGIKWGDLSDAEVVIIESASDGIKWGDLAEAITEAVGSLTDGIKWGDWGQEILGWDQIFSTAFELYYSSTYPGGSAVYTDIGGKIFSLTLYRGGGYTNQIRPAVYEKSDSALLNADLLKDFGVIDNASSGWQTIYDEDLTVISNEKYVFVLFKADQGSTQTRYEAYTSTQFVMVRSTETSVRTDPWDDPAVVAYQTIWGRGSIYLTVLKAGVTGVVQTSASISDGIKWGDDAVGVESGAETGDCTDGIYWGDSVTGEPTFPVSASDGIFWGDTSEGDSTLPVSVSDGIFWGDTTSGETGFFGTASDGIFWGDSISVEAASVVSATDGWKLGDSSSVTIVAPKSATDGILWGDQAVGSTEDNQVEVTDGILWGENIDTVTYEQFSGDGIKWGDSVSSFIGQWAVLVDGWVWGENFDLVTVTYFPDDGIVWGDSVFVGSGAAVDLTDGWKLGDVAAPFIGIFDSVEDGIKWGDSPEEDVISWNYCQDGIKWGDAISSVRTKPASATDKILWGDQIFVETQTGGGDTYYGNPSDGIKWGDSVSPLQQRVDSISDGWKMGDLISLNQSLGRTLIDGIRWGEAVAGSKADVYIDSLSDGWIWGDDTYYAELGALLSMDAYIVSMLGMMSDIEHRRLIGDVEVEHMLSMKPRIQK